MLSVDISPNSLFHVHVFSLEIKPASTYTIANMSRSTSPMSPAFEVRTQMLLFNDKLFTKQEVDEDNDAQPRLLVEGVARIEDPHRDIEQKRKQGIVE